MAKASSSSRPAHSRKPYSGGPANGSSNGQVSISKLKGGLRQATRLLAKDKLDAQLRVETERRVESLKRQLAEAEAARPLIASATSKPADTPAKSVEGAAVEAQKKDAKGKGKNKEDKADRYKMLRHFEYQKTSRRCKKCRKEIQALEEQLQATEGDKAKKKQKKLRKQLVQLESYLMVARIDAWYIEVSCRRPSLSLIH